MLEESDEQSDIINKEYLLLAKTSFAGTGAELRDSNHYQSKLNKK